MIAALLGADEYSFGTAAMLAEGCIMVRACHRDTCPTGIATQRPELAGEVRRDARDGGATYMLFVAEEVRALLACSGSARLDEAIGRVDLLRQRATGDAARRLVSTSSPLLRRARDGDAPVSSATAAIQRPRSTLGDHVLPTSVGRRCGTASVARARSTRSRTPTAPSARRSAGRSAASSASRASGGSARARFPGAAGQSVRRVLGRGRGARP